MEPTAYHALAEALRERLAVIADRDFYARDPAGHLAALQAASEKITDIGATLPRPLDPDLAHYLHKASYAKALAWIEQTGGG